MVHNIWFRIKCFKKKQNVTSEASPPVWGADHARCADLVAPRLAPVLGDDVNEHADADEFLVWVSVHITEAICEEVAPQSIHDRFSGAVPS